MTAWKDFSLCQFAHAVQKHGLADSAQSDENLTPGRTAKLDSVEQNVCVG
jgi:hypothetical protein